MRRARRTPRPSPTPPDAGCPHPDAVELPQHRPDRSRTTADRDPGTLPNRTDPPLRSVTPWAGLGPTAPPRTIRSGQRPRGCLSIVRDPRREAAQLRAIRRMHGRGCRRGRGVRERQAGRIRNAAEHHVALACRHDQTARRRIDDDPRRLTGRRVRDTRITDDVHAIAVPHLRQRQRVRVRAEVERRDVRRNPCGRLLPSNRPAAGGSLHHTEVRST